MNEVLSSQNVYESVHRIDARSKIIILFFLSFAVFFANTKSLFILFLIFFLLVFIDYLLEYKSKRRDFTRVLVRVFEVSIPLYIICFFSYLANAIVFNTTKFEFSQIGSLHGAFYVGRILLLGWSSLYVANTVSLIEFSRVFKWIFWPLRRFNVPVEDVTLAISIAFRFIPEFFNEFAVIKQSQWCRGAKTNSGSLFARCRAHCGCFAPLIVRMISKANDLTDALVVRCWGICSISPKEEIGTISVLEMMFVFLTCVLIIVLVALV